MAKKKKSKERAPEPVTDAAARVAVDLAELGARFALVGGLAVSAWGEPRYTRDVDVAVAVDADEDAEQLIRALSTRGYEIVTIIEQTRTHRLATARLCHADDRSVFIDLLFASSGIERELARAAARVGGVPVGRVGHLLALKVLSESDKRLQDRIDIEVLATIATDEDWRTAQAMVTLIKERGFHRGRALVTRLRRWRRSTSSPPVVRQEPAMRRITSAASKVRRSTTPRRR